MFSLGHTQNQRRGSQMIKNWIYYMKFWILPFLSGEGQKVVKILVILVTTTVKRTPKSK